jgi:hypothetical protein
MLDIMVARLVGTRVQTPLSPSIKCNVLRESLSEDSQNIPWATLKRRGLWVISVYLWQGVTKRCRLSLLTNSALVLRVQMRGGGVAGSQRISTAVHFT